MTFMGYSMRRFLVGILLFLTIMTTLFYFRGSDVQKMRNIELLEEKVANFDKDCLVVFDVDKTLITPIDPMFYLKSLSSKFWRSFYYILMTGDVFFRNLVEHYKNGHFTVKFELVDPGMPDLIKGLQGKGVKVIALTSCPTGMHKQVGKIEDWRIKHLLSFGIDFTKAFPDQGDMLFTSFSQTRPSLFKDGILFANGYAAKKGPLLAAFLERIGWRPREVVFVDDSAKWVRSVEKSMKELDIKCTGLQYVAADRFSKDMSRASIKLKIQSLIEHGRWVPSVQASSQ